MSKKRHLHLEANGTILGQSPASEDRVLGKLGDDSLDIASLLIHYKEKGL